MKNNFKLQRKPTAFEYTLLIMGIMIIGVGYYFLHMTVSLYGISSSETVICLMLWLITVMLIIITAVSENSKEELKIIIKQQHDELKLLREDFRRKK